MEMNNIRIIIIIIIIQRYLAIYQMKKKIFIRMISKKDSNHIWKIIRVIKIKANEKKTEKNNSKPSLSLFSYIVKNIDPLVNRKRGKIK